MALAFPLTLSPSLRPTDVDVTLFNRAKTELPDAWWVFAANIGATSAIPLIFLHGQYGIVVIGVDGADMDGADMDGRVRAKGVLEHYCSDLAESGFVEFFGCLPPVGLLLFSISDPRPLEQQLLAALAGAAPMAIEDPDWVEWAAGLLMPSAAVPAVSPPAEPDALDLPLDARPGFRVTLGPEAEQLADAGLPFGAEPGSGQPLQPIDDNSSVRILGSQPDEPGQGRYLPAIVRSTAVPGAGIIILAIVLGTALLYRTERSANQVGRLIPEVSNAANETTTPGGASSDVAASPGQPVAIPSAPNASMSRPAVGRSPVVLDNPGHAAATTRHLPGWRRIIPSRTSRMADPR
jgi:hypothetical protein